MSDNYTLVFLAWRKRRRNHRVIFGQPARHIRLDWQRSLAAFKPGELFAYERWKANKFGTQHWSISVLKAGSKGERLLKLPGIKPGAHLLMQRQGVPACKAFYTIVDTLRASGNLERTRPSDWQIIGHRLDAGTHPERVLHDMRLVR